MTDSRSFSGDQFHRVQNEFLTEESNLLSFKRGEYATDLDVLKNFRQQADFIGSTTTGICMVLAFKHIQGIQNILQTRAPQDLPWYWADGTKEGLKQRIADARNYLLLLACCIEDGQPTPDVIVEASQETPVNTSREPGFYLTEDEKNRITSIDLDRPRMVGPEQDDFVVALCAGRPAYCGPRSAIPEDYLVSEVIQPDTEVTVSLQPKR